VNDPLLSVDENFIAVSTLTADDNQEWYTIVSASMISTDVTEEWFSDQVSIDILTANGYVLSSLQQQFGWHGQNGDDSVPPTIALEAASFFPVI
jgi:hypothetical protein